MAGAVFYAAVLAVALLALPSSTGETAGCRNGERVCLAQLPAAGAAAAQPAPELELLRRVQAGTPASEVVPCANPREFRVNPRTIHSVIERLPACSVLHLEPGHYASILPAELDGLTIRCTEPSVVGGKVNPYGCIIRSIIPVRIGVLIVENMVFSGIATNFHGHEDYGVELHIAGRVRLSHNAFNGMYNHDISTKENVDYTEVFDNLFIRCERHCVEVGQNGNVPSRPQQSGTMIVAGNLFDSPRLHAVTQRSNTTLTVRGNYFRNVGGRSVQNWPYWQRYYYGQPQGPEELLVPSGPLRTSVANNHFEGSNRMMFEGRGIRDDRVQIRGNTGSFSCERTAMAPDTAAAHAWIEVPDPPRLDSASDVSC